MLVPTENADSFVTLGTRTFPTSGSVVRESIGTLLVVLAVISFASRIEGQVTQNAILERARNGDDTALSEMEKKGDVQDLQILLHDPKYAGKFAARLTLARMGDVEVLQYYACRSLTVDVSQVEDLMRQELDYIGGGFTIEIYRRFLDSDPRFIPQIEGVMEEARKHGGDSWPPLPSTLALLRLHKLVPDSPIPDVSPLQLQANPRATGEIKARWRSWIDTHQSELKKLKPTPRGVIFDSGRCSGVNEANAYFGR
jgi:hypothetical protein